MSFEVILSNQARKYLQKQPPKMKKALQKALEYLEKEPYKGPNIKRLGGELQVYYRYRIGSFRIIYEIYSTEQKIGILKILPRGGVY